MQQTAGELAGSVTNTKAGWLGAAFPIRSPPFWSLLWRQRWSIWGLAGPWEMLPVSVPQSHLPQVPLGAVRPEPGPLGSCTACFSLSAPTKCFRPLQRLLPLQGAMHLEGILSEAGQPSHKVPFISQLEYSIGACSGQQAWASQAYDSVCDVPMFHALPASISARSLSRWLSVSVFPAAAFKTPRSSVSRRSHAV